MGAEIQLSEDIQFEHRYWKLQRFSWVVLAMLLLVAALGLFGGGPLSKRTARDGGIAIEYSRFLRRNAPTPMIVHVAGAAAKEGKIVLAINSAYVRRMNLQPATPQPERVEVGADNVRFYFLVGSQTGDLALSFETKPRFIGRTSARIAAESQPEIELSQFVYP